MKKNFEIEVLRAYAITLVVFDHLPNLFPEISTYTAYYWLGGGVDLFFCISGYLIAGILLKAYDREDSFSAFYIPFFIKRIYRLWPAAIFWSLFAIVCSIFFNESHYFGTIQGNVNTAIAGLFQVVNFNLVSCQYFHFTHCEPTGLRVYWSLSLEEQFYFLFPLLLFFFGKRKIALISLILVLSQIFLHRPWPSPLWFFRTDAIALGILIAYLHHINFFAHMQLTFLKTSKYKPFIMIMLFALLVLVAKEEVVWFYHGLVVIVSGILVLLASFNNGVIMQDGIWRKTLSVLGSRSYSLYLTHMLGIYFIRELFFRYAGLSPSHTEHHLMFLIPYIIVVILFTEFSYRFIEEPLRNKGRQISKSLHTKLSGRDTYET